MEKIFVRPRNVIVLSDAAFVDGGAASVALYSAIGLAEAGLNVEVFSAIGPPMSELLSLPQLQVTCTEQAALGVAPLASFRTALWNDHAAALLSNLLTKYSPSDTILHVHNWTKALSASIFHVATRLGFSVVVTLHDYFSICPNGSLYLHQDERICELVPMSMRCIATNCDSRNYAVKAYRVVRQTVQKHLGGMPGEIRNFISVSDFSASIMRPYLPRDSQIYSVLNPVDIQSNVMTHPDQNSNFLFLGRLSPEKGANLFAKAALEADVLAVFAGDGACANEIRENNSQAKLLGWLDRSQVAAQLRIARALVLPSLWYETYGLSVMEAAAIGVPSIVPSTSAARDLVDHNESGLIFEGGNRQSLAAALTFLKSEGVAAALGAAAYAKFWSDPPLMEKHVANILDVYSQVLCKAA